MIRNGLSGSVGTRGGCEDGRGPCPYRTGAQRATARVPALTMTTKLIISATFIVRTGVELGGVGTLAVVLGLCHADE